jgi:hypothetical protein
VTVFGCGPGRLHVTVLIKTPVRIELTRDGTPWQTRTFQKQRVWDARIPAPPGHDGRDACSFELKPNALMGSTLIEFEPSA